jgi:Flp pilus assembly pilin Flp
MGRLLRHFLFDEFGQDLTEYALLLVFVVLAAGGIFLQSAAPYLGIWSLTNSEVVGASHAATGN